MNIKVELEVPDKYCHTDEWWCDYHVYKGKHQGDEPYCNLFRCKIYYNERCQECCEAEIKESKK